MKPIDIKKSNKGKLHKALGIALGKKIPAAKLEPKLSDSAKLAAEKLFARNSKKWKKR